MASPRVTELFDAFVDAHSGGERPDVRDYLALAGDERDHLGRLIDGYLQIAPVAPPDPETVVLLNARLEHVAPLTAARRRVPLKVDEVVDRLRELLGLREALRPKLRVAYQELEAGQLDADGVSGRVWDSLRTILGLDPRRLVTIDVPSYPAAAYLRSPSSASLDRVAAEIAPHEPPDEIDELFRGG